MTDAEKGRTLTLTINLPMKSSQFCNRITCINSKNYEIMFSFNFEGKNDHKFLHNFLITSEDLFKIKEQEREVYASHGNLYEEKLDSNLCEENIDYVNTIINDINHCFDQIVEENPKNNIIFYSVVANDSRSVEFLKERSFYQHYILSKSFSLYRDWSLYCDIKYSDDIGSIIEEIDVIACKAGLN